MSQEVIRAFLSRLQVLYHFPLLVYKFLNTASEPLKISKLNLFFSKVYVIKHIKKSSMRLHKSKKERRQHILHVLAQVHLFKLTILLLEAAFLVHIGLAKDTGLHTFVQEDLEE